MSRQPRSRGNNPIVQMPSLELPFDGNYDALAESRNDLPPEPVAQLDQGSLAPRTSPTPPPNPERINEDLQARRLADAERESLQAIQQASNPQVSDLIGSNPETDVSTDSLSYRRQAETEAASQRQRERLERASEARRVLMEGSPVREQIVIARQEGRGFAPGSVEDDLATMGYQEILRTYGPEVARQYANLNQENFGYAESLGESRTAPQIVGDSILGIGAGATGLLGGVITAGLAGTDAAGITENRALGAAQATEGVTGWIRDRRSEVSDFRDRRGSILDNMDAETNARMYDGDEQIYGPVAANIMRIGRDILSSGSNILSDPTRTTNVVSEALGSLAGSAGTTAALAVMFRNSLGTELSRRAIYNMNAAILGAGEGGGAYSDAAIRIMEMGAEFLEQNSPNYTMLREQGLSHEEAQVELAHLAGLTALVTVGPIAAGIGRIVSPFEVNPIAAVGRSGLGRNMLGQTLEEGAQEGITAFGANLGVQQQAIPSQDLGEGVGQGIAAGAIGGAGMAGVLGTPAAIGSGIAGAVRGASEGFQRGREALARDRTQITPEESIAEAQEASRTMSEDMERVFSEIPQRTSRREETEENTDQETDQEVETEERPVQGNPADMGREDSTRFVEETTRQVLRRTNAIPENEESEFVNRVNDLVVYGSGTIQRNYSPELESKVSETAKERKGVFNFNVAYEIGDLIQVIGDNTNPESLRMEAMAAIINIGQYMDALFESDLLDQLKAIEHKTAISVYEQNFEYFKKIKNNNFINNVLNEVFTPEQIDVLLNTESAQQRVDNPETSNEEKVKIVSAMVANTMAAMVSSAENITPQKYEAIISMMAKVGGIDQKRQAIIEMGKTIADAIAAQRNERKDLFKDKSGYQNTSDEFYTEGRVDKRGNKTKSSLTDYVREVTRALINDDIPAVRQIAKRFGNWRRSQENKVNAMRESYKKTPEGSVGVPVSYNSYSENGWGSKNNTMTFHRTKNGKEKSLEFAKAIAADLKLMESVSKALEKMVSDVRKGNFKNKNKKPKITSESNKKERTYKQSAVAVVAGTQKKYGKLSNMATNLPISIGTIVAGSSEALYQAMKFPDHPEIQKEILEQKKPMDAKRIARKHQSKVRPDWEKVNMKLMRWVLRMKLANNFDAISKVLDQTGDQKIVEYSAKDTFFGAKPDGQGNLVGQNVLGRLLMELRQALKTDRDSLKQMPELKGEGFLLLGQDLGKKADEAALVLVATKAQRVSYERITPDGTIRGFFFNTPWIQNFLNSYIFKKSDTPIGSEIYRELRRNNAALIDNNLNEEKREKEEAMSSLLNKTIPAIWNIMNKRVNILAQELNLKNHPDTDKVSKYRRAKILNFVEEMSDGTYRLNQDFMSMVMLAYGQWYIKEDFGTRRKREEEVASIFGVNESEVTPAMMKIARNNVPLSTVANRLVIEMEKYLRVSTNKDISRDQSGGILLGVALELIAATSEYKKYELVSTDNTLEIKEVPFKGNKASRYPSSPVFEIKDISYIDPRSGERVSKRFMSLDYKNPAYLTKMKIGSWNTFIEDAVLGEESRFFIIGEENIPKGTSTTIDGVPNAALTSDQMNAIKNRQKNPRFLNTEMFNLIKSMSVKRWKKLLGFQDIKEADRGNYNENHLLSIDGKNNTINYGIEAITELYTKIMKYAEENKMVIEDVPYYVRHKIAKNLRLMEDGFGGQNDRQIRELITPVKAELNLDPAGNNTEHQTYFWVSIAQGLGFKTNNKPVEDIANEMRSIFDGNNENSLIVYGENDHPLSIALQGVIDNNWDMMENGLQAAEITGNDIPRAIHALISLSRYRNAKENKSLSNFEHTLPVEADGVSDGPIQALVNMNYMERIDAAYLDQLAAGGFFINDDSTTTNSYRSKEEPGIVKDIYTMGANVLNNMIRAMKEEYRGQPLYAAGEASSRMIMSLADFTEFDNENGEFRANRNFMKNPFTVIVYGSGSRGISKKIAKQIVGKLYEHLSNPVKNGFPIEQLRDMVENVYKVDREGKVIKQNIPKNKLVIKDRITFTMSENQMKALVENINLFYGSLMYESVKELMPGVINTMTTMVDLSNIQSIIVQEVFDEKVRKKRAELKRDLSENEYIELLKEVAPINSTIYTEDQVLDILTTSRLSEDDLNGNARSMDENLIVTLPSPRPGPAGVKIAPYLVIGTGDARSVLRLANHKGGKTLERAMDIFDGIDFPVDNILSGSREVNRITSENWQTNYLGHMAVMFRKFFNSGTLQNMSKPVYDRLYKLIKDNPGKEHPIDIFTYKLNKLEQIARNNEALKKTLFSVATSTDHLATAEGNHVSEGQVIRDKDGNPLRRGELADYLNREFEKNKNEQKMELGPKLNFMNMGDNILGETNATSPVADVYEITLNNLFRYIGPQMQSDKFSAQKQIAFAAMKMLKKAGYKVIFGKPEKVRKYADAFVSGSELLGEYSGMVSYDDKKIVLTSDSMGAFLHEIVHAAIYEAMYSHYIRNDSSAEVKNIIDRMEGLREQFMNMDTDPRDKITPQIKQILKSYQGSGNPIDRFHTMSEFISWAVTYTPVIELLKKTKVENPLMRIAQSLLKYVKRLLGMNTVEDSMFENIVYNMHGLMRTSMEMRENQAKLEEASVKGAINREVKRTRKKNINSTMASGDAMRTPITSMMAAMPIRNNNYLAEIMSKFEDKLKEYYSIGEWDQTMESRFPVTPNREIRDRLQAGMAANHFSAVGEFNWSQAEKLAFSTIYNTLTTSMELDRAAMLEVQRVYEKSIANLKPTDLLTDKNIRTLPEMNKARARYEVLTGIRKPVGTSYGQSGLMAGFVAASQVDPVLRRWLNEQDATATVGSNVTASGAFEEMGTRAFNRIRDTIGRVFLKNQANVNSREALDNMILRMATIEDEALSGVEATAMGLFEKANGKIVDIIQTGVDWSIEKLNNLGQNSSNNLVRLSSTVGEVILGFHSNAKGEEYHEKMRSLVNMGKLPRFISETFYEMGQTTLSNERIYDLINPVKYFVNAARQHFREVEPSILASRFDRNITESEWRLMNEVMTRSDISSLGQFYSATDIQKMLADETSLNNEINDVKDIIKRMNSSNANEYFERTKALARYMVNNEVVNENLLTNAYAIAALLNQRAANTNLASDTKLVGNIDRLISLEAMKLLDKGSRKEMASLMKEQKKGMFYLYRYMNYAHELEMKKVFDSGNVAKWNHVKGKIEKDGAANGAIVVAPLSKQKELEEMSFVKLDSYKGSRYDAGPAMAYFYTTKSDPPSYQQGIMQTVQKTAYGVDAITGMDYKDTAGRIVGKEAFSIASRVKSRPIMNSNPGEYLRPVFDDKGNVYAYQRTLSKEMMDKLSEPENLARRIGAWRGRQIEETLADQFNNTLIDRLHENWMEGKRRGKDKEYIDFFREAENDPVYAHVTSIMPKQVKQYIRKKFGNDGFMIERGVIDNALGFPAASVGDFFTGTSRFNNTTQQVVKNSLISIFGKNAYNWMTTAESMYTNFISWAKLNIVVRSVKVGIANIVSNIHQLLLRGVPLSFFKRIPLLVSETNKLVENQTRMKILENEMAAFRDNKLRVAKLKAEYQSLKDQNRKMSISPLIEAGEFLTITNGLTEEDLKNKKNLGIMDKLEEYLERLPSGVRTLGKYAVISKDTQLFKFLNRVVMYGDFISKALRYQHMVEFKNASPKEAQRAIRNEFVNYNIQGGRIRNFMEGTGVMWFWNFKLRSVQTATHIMKTNPLGSALWFMAPWNYIPGIRNLPGINDSVLSDDARAKILEGTAARSLMPWSMLQRSISYNPYIAAMS